MVKPKQKLLQGNVAIRPQTCVQNRCLQLNEKAHKDMIQDFGPDMSGTFTK